MPPTSSTDAPIAQRLLRGGAWVVLGRIGATLSLLLVHGLLARLLTPSELGTYFLASSIVISIATVGQLGLTQASVRLLSAAMAAGRSDQIWSITRTILSYGVVGALVAAAAVNAPVLRDGLGKLFTNDALVQITPILGFWITFTVLQGLVGECFRGLEDFRDATAMNGVIPNLLAAGCFGLLWMGGRNLALRDAVGLMAITVAIACIAGLGALARRTRRLATLSKNGAGHDADPTLRSRLFATAGPLLVHNVASLALLNADLWIVGALCDPEQLGIYGAATKVGRLISLPLLVGNAVLAPIISALHAKGQRDVLERSLRTIAALTFVTTAALFVAMAIAPAKLLTLLFAPEYASGATILMIVSFGHLLNVWAGSGGTTLAMTGHPRLIMTATLVSGTVLVVSAILLVQQMGSRGAGVAVVLGIVVHNVLVVGLVHRYVHVWTMADLRTIPQTLGRAASWMRESGS